MRAGVRMTAGLVWAAAGWAAGAGAAGAGAKAMVLLAGSGAVIDCPGGVARASTSNPETVDLVPASDHEILFQAKAPGDATLVVWSRQGTMGVYQVKVERDVEPLRALLREAFPGEAIELHAARDSVVLTGRASTREVAERALALVTASAKGAVSDLQVPPPPPARQILLRVRFAELDRSLAEQVGLSLFSTGTGGTVGRITTGQFSSGGLGNISGGGGSASAPTTFSMSDLLNIFAFRSDLNLGILLSDLQSQGVLQILAEPNLVATEGKEATFLAGGEFPVPVVQAGAAAGAITIQYREYGIRLSFVTRFTPGGMLSVHIRPEVSTIDPTKGVEVSGFNIPALATRRIETDVELAPGQSFAIAGLLDDRATQNLSRIPGLANIPVLGALFRSRAVTRNRTELVVVVTPEPAPAVLPPMPALPIPFLGPVAGGRQ